RGILDARQDRYRRNVVDGGFLRLFLNPWFQPTIRMSLTSSQRLRRPPEVTYVVKTTAEKAGVGGSTPSLATIIPKNLFELPSTASVRSRSAFANAPKTACCTSLTSRSLAAGSSFSVRFQSALVRRMAEYCNEHFSCCGHPILADGVAVELKRELNIAVA